MPSLLGRRLLSGLLLIDKPSGPTSHDAVLWARRVLDRREVGHCGALDPAATGLLLLVVGEALSLQNRFMSERKVYEGTIRLGLVTDTDDLSGKPLTRPWPKSVSDIVEEQVRQGLETFLGVQEQEVPLYSAVKVNGEPLYKLARQGIAVEKPKKTVEVYRLDPIQFSPPDVSFRLECSKGFYVRSLARDLGNLLGVGGTLAQLSREAVGPYTRTAAYPWQDRSELDLSAFERSFIPIEKLSFS